MKRNLLKLFSLQNIIALLTIFFGIVFWVYTINGLPKTVENHETRITTLEKDNIEFKTKQDLMLNAIFEIRSVLLKK